MNAISSFSRSFLFFVSIKNFALENSSVSYLFRIYFPICILGAPQVLRLHPSMHTVLVKKGDPASLTLVVCADPRPQRVAWEWGSLHLEAGSTIGSYTYIHPMNEHGNSFCISVHFI